MMQKSFTGIFAAITLDFFLILCCYLQWRKEKNLQIQQNNVPLKAVSSDGRILISDEIQRLDGKEKLYKSFVKATVGKNLRMRINFQQLSYSLPSSGEVILECVSGRVRDGKFLAIIGPSGCGKSTLLNVLCGKVNRTFGKVFISGKEVELEKYKKIYGLVTQEDSILPELTVREHILYSARIRLPSAWSTSEIETHVDNILVSLNLSSIAHSIVSDLSRGESKKVNIGIELASTPLCMLLDEPTTGLDSTSALEIAEILAKITSLGVTVVAITHQPRIEIFDKFDDIMLMVPGGRVAYYGPAKEAASYFKNLGFKFPEETSEADTLMDILSEKGVCTENYTVDHLVKKWSQFCEFMEELIPENLLEDNDKDFHTQVPLLIKEKGATMNMQLRSCVKISLLQQYRRISGLYLEIAIAIVAGLLIGFAVNFDELYVGVVKVYLILTTRNHLAFCPYPHVTPWSHSFLYLSV